MKIFSTYLSSIDSLNRLESRKHYVFKPYYDFTDPYKVVDRQPEYEVELNTSYTNTQNTSQNDINVISTGIDMPRFSIDNLVKKREYTDYIIVDSTFVDANIITYPTDRKVSLSSTLLDSEIKIDVLHFNTDPTSYDITTKESFKRGSSYRKIKIPYQKVTNEPSKYIVIDDNYYAPRVDNVIIHDLKTLGMELISSTVTDILEKHKPSVIGYSIPRPKEKKSALIENYVDIDGVEVVLKVVTDIGNITTDIMFFEENAIELTYKEVEVKDIRDTRKFSTFNLSETLKVRRPSYNRTKSFVKNVVVNLVSGVKTLVTFEDDTIEIPSEMGIGIYDDLQLSNELLSISREYYSAQINKVYPHSESKRGLLVVKNDGSYIVTDDYNEMSLDSSLKASFSTFNEITTKRWSSFETRLALIPSFYRNGNTKELHGQSYQTVINGSVFTKSKILGDVTVFSPSFRKYNGLPTHFYTKPQLLSDIEYHNIDVRVGKVSHLYQTNASLGTATRFNVSIEKHHSSTLKHINKPLDLVGDLFRVNALNPRKITDEIGALERDRLVYTPTFIADKITTIIHEGYNVELSLGSHNVSGSLYGGNYFTSDIYDDRLINSLSGSVRVEQLYTKKGLDSHLFSAKLTNNPIKSTVYVRSDLYSEVIPVDINERTHNIAISVVPPRDIFNEVAFNHFEVAGFTKGKIFTGVPNDKIPVNINLTSHNVTKIFIPSTGYERNTRYDFKVILPTIPGLVSKVYNSGVRYDSSDLIEKILIERESADIKFEKLYTRDVWTSIKGAGYELKGKGILSYSSSDVFKDLKPTSLEITSYIKGELYNKPTSNLKPITLDILTHISGVIFKGSSNIPKTPIISIEQKNTIEDRVYKGPIKLSLVPNLIDSLYRGTEKVYKSGKETKVGTGITITSTVKDFTKGSYLTDIVGSGIDTRGVTENGVYQSSIKEKIGSTFDNRTSIEGVIYTHNSKAEYTSPITLMSVREESKERPLRIPYDATRQERDIVVGFDGIIYKDKYSTILSEITGFTDRSPDRHTFNYAKDSSKLSGLHTYRWDTLALVDNIYGKTDKLHLGSTPLPHLFSQEIYKFIEPRYAKLERPQGVTSHKSTILGLVYNGYLQRQKNTELTLDLNAELSSSKIYNEYLRRVDNNSGRTITLSTGIRELYNNSLDIKVDYLRLNDVKETVIPAYRTPFNPSIKYNDVALGKKLTSKPSYIGVNKSFDVSLGQYNISIPHYEREVTLKNFDSSRVREIYSPKLDIYRDITTLDFNGLELSTPVRYSKSLDEFNRDYPTTTAVNGLSYSNYFGIEKSYNIDLPISISVNYNKDYSKDIKYVLDLALPGPSLIYDNYSRLELFSREGYEDSRVFRYDNYSQKEQYERMFTPSRVKVPLPFIEKTTLYREISSIYEDIQFGLFRYDNYSQKESYDKSFEGTRASVPYQVTNYNLGLYSTKIDVPSGKLRYENDLSKYKTIEDYNKEIDLRVVNNKYNRLATKDRDDNVAYTLKSSIYGSYNFKKESLDVDYRDSHILHYDKPFDKAISGQSFVSRLERPYDITNYRGVEHHTIEIESYSYNKFYTKDIYESQYPSYNVMLPITLDRNTYASIPSIVSNSTDVKYNLEVKLYNKPFEGTVNKYNTSYGIEQLYISDYTRDMSINDIGYNLSVNRIYPSVSAEKHSFSYNTEKVSVEKLYTPQYFKEINEAYDIKVSVNRVYDNLYVGNVTGLVHNYDIEDSDSPIINKESVYNKYNYHFDSLTDLYSKPSVALYDKPFLKWIPRWYKESKQSYNVENNVNLRTIDGYRFILPVVDYSIDIATNRVRYNKPISINDVDVKTSIFEPFRYDNDLSKYSNNYPSITIDTPVLYSKNYLTYSSSVVEKIADLSTFRYDNNVDYTPVIELKIGSTRENNYLVKTDMSDILSSPSYVGLRYENNLESYKSTYVDIKLNRPKTNYIPTAEYVIEVITSEFRYNNTLSKYRNNIDVKTLVNRDNNYLTRAVADLTPNVNISTFRYENDLESYTETYDVQSQVIFRGRQPFSNVTVEQPADVSSFRYDNNVEYTPTIEVKTSHKLSNNYLSNVEVPLTSDLFRDITLRYDNRLDKYNKSSVELKTSDIIERNTYNTQKEVYKQFNRTDLSNFGYKSDIAKHYEYRPLSTEKSTFRYENNRKESFKRSIDVSIDCPVLVSPSYNRIQHKSYDYKSTVAPDLRVSSSFNKITDTTLGHNFKPNIATVNNLFAKKEILSGIDKSKYTYSTNAVKGALYPTGDSAISDRKFILNRTIQPLAYNTDKIHKRVITERLTPVYKGEFKYTDTETRFTLRGPVNYNMYGDEVKVVMMEQNKEGFVWEQQIDNVAYKSKNLLQQESAYVYKKEPIVVASSPVLTRENQIEYYFGGQGKLKMEQISATYSNPDGGYMLAAPVNCTVKGIMRPTTSVAIQHIIEHDYNKIDEVNVAPVFNETGDRVSLFSDRFFLQ